jgi:hypothetical protein
MSDHKNASFLNAGNSLSVFIMGIILLVLSSRMNVMENEIMKKCFKEDLAVESSSFCDLTKIDGRGTHVCS